MSADQLRAVRIGHGGNCSSVGSVIDTLFVGAALGSAIVAAVCTAMQTEDVTVLPLPRAGEHGATTSSATEEEP